MVSPKLLLAFVISTLHLSCGVETRNSLKNYSISCSSQVNNVNGKVEESYIIDGSSVTKAEYIESCPDVKVNEIMDGIHSGDNISVPPTKNFPPNNGAPPAMGFPPTGGVQNRPPMPPVQPRMPTPPAPPRMPMPPRIPMPPMPPIPKGGGSHSSSCKKNHHNSNGVSRANFTVNGRSVSEEEYYKYFR